MRRFACLVLAALFAVLLLGCHYSESGDILEPVEFFYPRKTSAFAYGSADGIIDSEIREASGHIDDLNYLITMYLYGPQEPTMRSPFPSGCKLVNIRTEADTLYLHLCESFTSLENVELTIACTALARTCMSITDYQYVCIDATSGGKTVSLTLSADSVLFADNSAFDLRTTSEESN